MYGKSTHRENQFRKNNMMPEIWVQTEHKPAVQMSLEQKEMQIYK